MGNVLHCPCDDTVKLRQQNAQLRNAILKQEKTISALKIKIHNLKLQLKDSSTQ